MSTPVEETPVSTETTPPVATGRAAFAAARAQLDAQSKRDQGSTEAPPPSDDTPAQTPVEEPAPVADQPSEPTETTEDTILTADELSKLSPKDREKALKWTTKLTQRSQALAARQRELEQLAEQLRQPSEPAQDTAVQASVTAQTTEALNELPAELQPLFKPVLEALERKFMAALQQNLSPIAEVVQSQVSESVAAKSKAEDEAFAAKHADYRQFEPKMIELGMQFLPAPGVTTDAYLENLYTLAKAGQTKVEQVKETVKQINKSVEGAEPRTAGVKEAHVEQTRPANWDKMTSKERMRASYDAAKNGVVWNQ